jgi:hypothetical protein
MTDDAGKSLLFKVNSTGSLDIIELKDLIKEKHLTASGKNVSGSVKLEGEPDNTSGHWPATTPPNPQHLHIIVELPSGERCVHCGGGSWAW